MKRVFVFRRSDGEQVYDYGGPLVELDLFPFSEYFYSEQEVQDPEGPIINYSRQVWTRADFMRRLTQTERIDLRARRAVDPVTEDYMLLLELDDIWANDDADVLAAMNYFKDQGIFNQARFDQVLYG